MDLNWRQPTSTAKRSSNSGAQGSEPGGPSAGDAPVSLSTRFPGHVDWSTYPFVELRDCSLDRDDLTFLTAKGCLSIPDTQPLHEFVRNYFLYVHPGFPVLNEAEFWVSYTRSRVGYSKIPLLVLQAVLFASSAYVTLSTIQACGFRTKTEARNAFYKRAKLLFDFHGEDSPLAQAQGAVLLSHHASAAEPQAGTDWLARAIQSTLALDNSPEPQISVDCISKKRLWWSIVLRDRCLSLALHRRTQMPVINQSLQIDILDEGDFSDEIMNSYVYDPPTKRVLVYVLKEHHELALALSNMMPLVYSSHGIRVPSLSKSGFDSTLARVRRVECTLDRWLSTTKLPSLMDSKAHESVAVFVNLVYMYYYAARINLTHFELLTIENHPNCIPTPTYTAHLGRAAITLTKSMHHLTSVLEFLGHQGKTHTLPLSLLGCLPMPLLTTALDISLASSSSQMALHKRRLHTLGQVLRSLEQVYEAAAMISAGMSHFLHLAYMTVQLPLDRETQMAALFGSTDNMTGSFTSSPISEQSPSTSTPIAVEGRPLSRTWKDFLLQSPRAYLLISTTVDYSLCIGHLPHDHALPDMLTCVFPGSLKIRFPWNGSEDEYREEVQVVTRRERPVLQGGENAVNLDYLDLGAAR
ncbi:hypothetical protein BJX68DRAFT_279302 [Aspergillus pseudodeflectus]|uniref:Xylanolytic transcriptional activator regulatory domain-containing protein n=1 Tax=Aspergillus pseudodeflectus TaxID=176178 RepID=A0ABR4JLL4_9EURO